MQGKEIADNHRFARRPGLSSRRDGRSGLDQGAVGQSLVRARILRSVERLKQFARYLQYRYGTLGAAGLTYAYRRAADSRRA